MGDSEENPKKVFEEPDVIQDLMVSEKDKEGETHRDKTSVSTSVKEIASRIPESLSAIGRDISKTLERAISAKDDYIVAVKLSETAQEKIDQLVQAGLYRSRAEAAAFLIDEGIKSQTNLFETVEKKLGEIERLRAEIRGLVNETKN